VNRTPPDDVRRILRREVGFGCPVDDCDSPYLSWHHFDPPWSDRQHQDPSGMVALCVLHHGQADEGAFTPDQLRAFKDPTRNGAEQRVKGTFRWKRDRLILLAGGNWWTQTEILLRCGSIPMIWLSRDSDGYELLNLDLFDDRGIPRLQLRDNDWIVDRQVDDLECSPRKASLVVRTVALGAELSISFERATRERVTHRAIEISRAADRDLPNWLRERWGDYRRPSPEETGTSTARTVLEGIPEAESALCVIEGKLRWPIEITLEPARIVLPGNNTITGGVMTGGHVGIQIN
jgi:hypothetical protein